MGQPPSAVNRPDSRGRLSHIGMIAQLILSRLLTADVKQAAKVIMGADPLTSFTVLHSLVKKPASLNLQPAGANAPLYNEIQTSPTLEQFAAGLIAGAGAGYDSLDNQASATITLSNFAGNTLTAPIEGVIGEGRDINVIAFNLGYQGNSGFLSLSIGGTFNGTTMVMTLLQAENTYGLDDDSTSSNGVFDLTLT